MTGFQKEFWGVRANLSSIFASLKPIAWTNEASYLKPKASLEQQVVKRRLPFDNKGIYTTQEIAYLRDYFREKVTCVEKFHNMLDNPSDDLARNFWEHYAPSRDAVKSINQALGQIYVQRARIVFPIAKKGKKNAKWAALPLSEKLLDIDDDNLREFSPTKLPGFSSLKPARDDVVTQQNLIRIKYRLEPENDDLRFAVAESFEATLQDRQGLEDQE
jgi:hypothetical protein